MNLTPTSLAGLVVLEPKIHGDDRGYFLETYNINTMAAAGIDTVFVQDNHSHSVKAHTVRGLHYQAPPRAQAKLVRCVRGRMFDVAVDIRKGSPTYGQWHGVELSQENQKQLFVPEGFLHGFVTLTEGCDVAYKCSDVYDRDCDGAIAFDDPDLAVDWGVSRAAAHLSAKDAAAPAFAGFDSPFAYEATS